MAAKQHKPSGNWEYRFTRKGVLPKPVWMTFATEAEGDAFAARVEAVLATGKIPPELNGEQLDTLGKLLEKFLETPLSQSDKDLIPLLIKRLDKVKVTELTYTWVEKWLTGMFDEGLAPGTVTKRIGLLARCVDWTMRSNKASFSDNPLRLLPTGYATKGRVSKDKAWSGERDRRLEPTEEGAIRKVLIKEEEHLLFDMALETAMRMREIYTLTVDQVNFDQSTIFLDKTKNGDKRQVPMSSVIKAKLKSYMETLEGDRLFPGFWDGDMSVKALKAATNRVSHLFASRFEKAGCPDVRTHDLRHEATSRLYERTKLSDIQISRITGHKDLRMLRRYSNLRGSDLSSQMW